MEQNKYRVIVSKQAAQMLVNHAAFLAQSNRGAAERLKRAFQEAANSLEVIPQRCTFLVGDSIPNHVYRYLLFEKRYMMVFQIKDNIVYVDFIVDCRQDYGWLFR